ncbi:MAG: type 4a pilus biogenesis protein PilO [Planctomycetaceae bacterium]|nr:type 4a pilus biogenesis protein PilO [Planctomycetaceae bacterium]
MKKKLKKHVKFINLVWISSVALSVFTYFVAIAPQSKVKQQVTAQLADREMAYATISKINNKQAQEDLNNKMKQWKDDIKQYVIAENELAGLTFDIGQIAKDTKIDSFSITLNDAYLKQKTTTKYITEKQLKVEFKTDFNKFAAFLNAVERHRPAVVINEFTIGNAEHDASASQVNMILSVFVSKKQGS